MVKLPEPSEEPVRPARPSRPSGSGVLRPENFRNWGARYGRDIDKYRREPSGLLQLDALVKRAIEVIEKHPFVPRSENNYERLMDLLRQQHNLNFIVVCEKCGGTHGVDELIAPER